MVKRYGKSAFHKGMEILSRNKFSMFDADGDYQLDLLIKKLIPDTEKR